MNTDLLYRIIGFICVSIIIFAIIREIICWYFKINKIGESMQEIWEVLKKIAEHNYSSQQTLEKIFLLLNTREKEEKNIDDNSKWPSDSNGTFFGVKELFVYKKRSKN